jgi:hypothetical protein
MLVGKCVHKKNPDGSAGELVGCSDSVEEAEKHMKALYANVSHSLVQMSMAITKASFDKKNGVMRWRAVASDTAKDLYDEQMSLELFKDFVSRIEDNDPLPEPFDTVLSEDTWNGGMPYVSIAHYKSGVGGKNICGDINSIYIDGNCLKAKGTCRSNELGLAVFNSLCDDLYSEKSDTKNKIRISIGFLDLEHKHVGNNMDYVFTRKGLTDVCPLCADDVQGKIYIKGQLVHLALTRIPVNPRTEMELEEKAMTTKREDAESIVKDKVDLLVEDSLAADAGLVIKSDGEQPEEQPVVSADAAQTVVSDETPVVVEESTVIGVVTEEKPAEKKEEKAEMKSAIDLAWETVKSKILEVKSSGLSGDNALALIQPEFNALGNILKSEFTTPEQIAKNEMAEVIKSAVSPLIEEIGNLKAELAKMQAQQLVPNKPADTVVKSRAMTITPNLSGAEQAKLSQIERLARGLA